MVKDDKAIYTAYDDHVALDSAVAERNLMRAVLRTAMEDMKKSGYLYRDARTFFISEDDSHLYSFKSICYHLGISPLALRRHVGIVGPKKEKLQAA